MYAIRSYYVAESFSVYDNEVIQRFAIGIFKCAMLDAEPTIEQIPVDPDRCTELCCIPAINDIEPSASYNFV